MLSLSGELDKYRRGFAVIKASASLDGELVTEAIIKASMATVEMRSKRSAAAFLVHPRGWWAACSCFSRSRATCV